MGGSNLGVWALEVQIVLVHSVFLVLELGWQPNCYHKTISQNTADSSAKMAALRGFYRE